MIVEKKCPVERRGGLSCAKIQYKEFGCLEVLPF